MRKKISNFVAPRYTHKLMNIFRYTEPFLLESGETLPGITIAYHTYGALNESKNNAVWVMHALTANSDVADWWPHTVENGKFLDPEKHFVICANVIGSCYGSSGPCSEGTDGSAPLYADFPDISVRDMVEAHRLLAKYLGITKINTIIGSSLGGFQALEWMAGYPEEMERGILVATDYKCRPWLAAINASMYMAIEADATYGQPDSKAGAKGLAAARSIGLLSYRSYAAYDATQADAEPRDSIFDRKAHGYQRYQGKKLCDRYDAYSYVKMCRSTDSHDVGRGRGGVGKALANVKIPVLVVAITTDILFPPSHHEELAAMLPDSRYKVIDSDFAHDGFLIEHEKLNVIISEFYNETSK